MRVKNSSLHCCRPGTARFSAGARRPRHPANTRMLLNGNIPNFFFFLYIILAWLVLRVIKFVCHQRNRTGCHRQRNRIITPQSWATLQFLMLLYSWRMTSFSLQMSHTEFRVFKMLTEMQMTTEINKFHKFDISEPCKSAQWFRSIIPSSNCQTRNIRRKHGVLLK